jgi:outer membrane protein OmpA-like peptidoglycan-associated protein
MKTTLETLVKKLKAGYSITVTGFAKDNAALAKRRAEAVVAFLDARVKDHVVVKVVTNTKLSKVTVATTKT